MNAALLIDMLIEKNALKFGSFVLNSGRVSPYFFNLGAIDDGQTLTKLGEAYANRIETEGLVLDILFGPAYKGIPIAVSAAIGLSGLGQNVGVSYNRKIEKGHGEGGVLVGADLSGQVVLVDDVLTSGKAIRESVNLIKSFNANISGVITALDRKEKNVGGKSARQELVDELGVPVLSLASIDDVIEYLSIHKDLKEFKDISAEMNAYRSEFCVD